MPLPENDFRCSVLSRERSLARLLVPSELPRFHLSLAEMPIMDTLLRKLVEWKARRRAAQIIIFDGAPEYDRARSFVRGAACGVTLTLVTFLLSAPDSPDDRLVRAIAVREDRLQEAQERLHQAMAVADVCLNTAQNLERTLDAYQAFLGGRTSAPPIPIRTAPLAD